MPGRIPRIVSALLLAAGVFSLLGCASGPRAADLYVDALVLKETGQADQAVEKLDAAVKADPRFSPAYSLLGDLYQQAKDYENSARAYRKAAELNEWSFYDYFNLGKVYQIMERFADAVQAYVRACELDPDHFRAHLNTSRCYYELEQYDSALEYGSMARAIDPNVSDVEQVLGDIYEAKLDYDQAIASYRRALELEGNRPDIMMSLAVAYLRSARYNHAEELLSRVVEMQPENSQAHQYLGYCHLRLREQKQDDEARLTEVEKAVQSYRRAIQIDDSDWMAHKGLGVALMMKMLATEDEQLKATALGHWKKSLQLNPDQPNSRKLRKLLSLYSR